MLETLNSIYLRLDTNMQYLASKATAQIIVKIVYSNSEGSMSASDIKKELAKLNEGKRFDDTEVDDILKDLENHELRHRNSHYYLSTNMRKKIERSLKESENRLDNILDKYFNGLNSCREDLKNWLSIITISFFETYSNEWISDINANTKLIMQSSDSIRQQVTRRTESIKGIDKEDRKKLPMLFFDFLNSHDSDVEDFLWGYGTSAFASKLLRNKYGVDKLTMESFKDSVCVLDTNVLLYIALESKYADSFKAIEKVFLNLNIQPKYLFITQKEYENKVRSQRDVILSNYDKFGYDTISRLGDDFTKSSIRSGCRIRDDFERFFNSTLTLPNFVHQNLAICLMDDDPRLTEEIEIAQKDESLQKELNSMYKAIVGRDKSQFACRHDIGLLEGVRYLRNQEDAEQTKYFIISDEISVNQYSKKKGTRNNLPLSLRVDTLINMLAVNNDGDTFDASDYKPLFANIIRLGLIPRKDTFNQEELYQMSQMNERISTLPPDQVCDIAMKIHRKMLDGEPESDIRRELNKLVTRGELQVKDEIRDIKGQLAAKSDEQKRLTEELLAAQIAVRKQVEDDYDKETKKLVCRWWLYIVLFFMAVLLITLYIIKNNKQDGSMLTAYVIGIIGNLVVTLVSGLIAQKKVINSRKKMRLTFIVDEVNRRLG